MGKLLIFNLILIAFIALGLWLVKKRVKKERTQNIVFLAAAMFTIVFHYSAFLFRLLKGDNAIGYLSKTPNLLLPIYPCNVVMWSALIFALLKNKRSPVGALLQQSEEMTLHKMASTERVALRKGSLYKKPSFVERGLFSVFRKRLGFVP